MGHQNKIIERGEQIMQELKKAHRTSQIDQVISHAYEQLDSM